MKTKHEVISYWAEIFIGLREGYDGVLHDLGEVRGVCQDYVDEIGLCVTVTPTTYIYRDGAEAGAVVGLIKYPRFPKSEEEIRGQALALARVLKKRFGQKRVTVMFPDATIMLGEK